jgi:hypothetical protein
MIIGNDTYAAHKPYRNVKSVARLLGDLARINQSLGRGHHHPSTDHFTEALAQVRRLARSNYRIYFISDFQAIGDHWRDAFRSLSRHNEVIALRIYDPLERQLPPSDSYTVTDGESRWQFHAGNPRLRQHYEAQFDNEEQRFKKICEQSAVEYRSVSTDVPLSRIPGWL